MKAVEMKKDLFTGRFGDCLVDYSGYICDAFQEIADSNTSIYYYDIDKYANENPSAIRDAIELGYALDGREYFKANPNDDCFDYLRHCSQAAQYMEIRDELSENVFDSVELCVIVALEQEFGEELSTEAFAYAKENASRSWDDENERIEDIREESIELYAEFIELAA